MSGTMQTVRAHGGIQPIENADIIDDVIYKEHVYYNTLVELEHARREAIRRVQKTVRELFAAEERYDEADRAVLSLKAQEKAAKSNDGREEPPAPKAVAEARAERTAAKKSVEGLRAKHAQALEPAFRAIEEEYRADGVNGPWGVKFKAARKACGVPWGTYMKIDEAFRMACVAEPEPYMVDGRPRLIRPWVERPAFRNRADKQYGLVAVHIQNRVMRPQDIFGDDTFVRIDPPPPNAYDPSIPRGKRNKLQRTKLHLRIGSDERGRPIWGTWPIFLHRPLPEHTEERPCRITWVVVTRAPREHGWRYDWECQITLEMAATPAKPPGEAVAVNLGWRRMEDGTLRVATWADTTGEVGELRLDVGFGDRIRKAWRIRSVRDKQMDVLRDRLVQLGVPCEKWKSFRTFYALLYQELAREKSTEPRLYPEEVLKLLRPWVFRDRHLWWYARGCCCGAINYRREVYRHLALRLAKRYRTIIVEAYDIRNISENEAIPRGPGAQRVEGCPSQAREILCSTGVRLGCAIIEGDSYKATQKCHVCGDETPWDAAPAVMHTCANGHTWDQDVNNARNALASAAVALKTLDPLAVGKIKQRSRVGARFGARHKKNVSVEGEK